MIPNNQVDRAMSEFLDQILAEVDRESDTETEAQWPTVADRAQVAYQSFKIGMFEMEHERYEEAESWLRHAAGAGVVEAAPILRMCREILAATSTPASEFDQSWQPEAQGGDQSAEDPWATLIYWQLRWECDARDPAKETETAGSGVVDHATTGLDAMLPVTFVMACRATAALPPSPARRALPGPGSLFLPTSEAVGGREAMALAIPTASALLAPDVDNLIHFAGHGASIQIWSLTSAALPVVFPIRGLPVDFVADHGSVAALCAAPDSWRPAGAEAVTPAELARCIDDLARRSDHGDGSRIQWLARRTHQVQGVVVDEVVLWAESAPDDQEGSRAGHPGKCPVE